MSTIELTVTARAYREIQAEIKALEEQADALKQTMIKEMDARQADSLQAGEYTIRYSLYESSRLDSAKLKAEHSDLYARLHQEDHQHPLSSGMTKAPYITARLKA